MSEDKTQLCVVGAHIKGDRPSTAQWSLVGIFNSDDDAQAACTDERHFIMYVNADETYNHRNPRVIWYPKTEKYNTAVLDRNDRADYIRAATGVPTDETDID